MINLIPPTTKEISQEVWTKLFPTKWRRKKTSKVDSCYVCGKKITTKTCVYNGKDSTCLDCWAMIMLLPRRPRKTYRKKIEEGLNLNVHK